MITDKPWSASCCSATCSCSARRHSRCTVLDPFGSLPVLARQAWLPATGYSHHRVCRFVRFLRSARLYNPGLFSLTRRPTVPPNHAFCAFQRHGPYFAHWLWVWFSQIVFCTRIRSYDLSGLSFGITPLNFSQSISCGDNGQGGSSPGCQLARWFGRRLRDFGRKPR
jgi:hypothetical protein